MVKVDLVKKLSGCRKGRKFWCSETESIIKFNKTVIGAGKKVYFNFKTESGVPRLYNRDGSMYVEINNSTNRSCVVFPSKTNHDWNSFKIKKIKYDPKLDRGDVVICSNCGKEWKPYFYIDCIKGKHFVCSTLFMNSAFGIVESFEYIVPSSKFNTSNIEESKEFNIVKINEQER